MSGPPEPCLTLTLLWTPPELSGCSPMVKECRVQRRLTRHGPEGIGDFPAYSAFPDALRLWEDDPGHFVWEPTVPMPLMNYVSLLAIVNPLFVKI